ncbi:MAG TPA: hypothetical protein VMB75_01270 [Rhodocyclaceae bacterium]|nr:hypothetical protein [Rhodocyclaceae bacterium]
MMRRKLIPIPARLFAVVFLALLIAGFLPSSTPSAYAGSFNDNSMTVGRPGGPDDPSGNPPTDKNSVRPKDPLMGTTVGTPHQSGDVPSNEAGLSWLVRMLLVIQQALQGTLHLS